MVIFAEIKVFPGKHRNLSLDEFVAKCGVPVKLVCL